MLLKLKKNGNDDLKIVCYNVNKVRQMHRISACRKFCVFDEPGEQIPVFRSHFQHKQKGSKNT